MLRQQHQWTTEQDGLTVPCDVSLGADDQLLLDSLHHSTSSTLA